MTKNEIFKNPCTTFLKHPRAIVTSKRQFLLSIVIDQGKTGLFGPGAIWATFTILTLRKPFYSIWGSNLHYYDARRVRIQFELGKSAFLLIYDDGTNPKWHRFFFWYFLKKKTSDTISVE